MKTENRNIEEKILHPANGVVMLVVDLILLVAFGFLLAIGIRQAVDAHVVAAFLYRYCRRMYCLWGLKDGAAK